MFTLSLLACSVAFIYTYKTSSHQTSKLAKLVFMLNSSQMPSVVTGRCKNLIGYGYMFMNKISMSQTYNKVVLLAGLYIRDIVGNLTLVGYMRM